MTILHYRVHHLTEYRYSSPVQLSRQLLRLTPRNANWQQVHSHTIRVEPEPNEWVELTDFFGNPMVQFALQQAHNTLTVEVESLVTIIPRTHAYVADETQPWEQVRDQLLGTVGGDVLEPSQFLFASPHVALTRALAEYAASCFTPGRPLLAALLELNHRIFTEFKYDPKATTISTPVEQVLAQKRGVCQDFAHLMIACLRSLGLSARYVSGYILTQPPPGKPRLIGADASHAWVSAWCPPLGWVDLDPTNDKLVDTQHITVAWGRDFSDVSPMRGVILGGGAHKLDVGVTVEPLDAGIPDLSPPAAADDGPLPGQAAT